MSYAGRRLRNAAFTGALLFSVAPAASAAEIFVDNHSNGHITVRCGGHHGHSYEIRRGHAARIHVRPNRRGQVNCIAWDYYGNRVRSPVYDFHHGGHPARWAVSGLGGHHGRRRHHRRRRHY